MKRLALMVVTLAMLVATASTLFATEPAPPFALLTSDRKADDRLPEVVTESPVARDLGNFKTARRVGSFRGADYFLMRGAKDQVCMVRSSGDMNVAAVCFPWDAESLRTVVHHGTLDADGNHVIAVAVPDGYNRVTLRRSDSDTSTEVPIVNNVAFAISNATVRVELSGPRRAPIGIKVKDFRRFLR